MKERAIAKRYAQALFELAVESKEPGRVQADLEKIAAASKGVPALLRSLSEWRVDIDRRVAVAMEVARALKVGDITEKFLKYLVRRERIPLFPLICQDFMLRMERYAKLAVASAVVAEAPIAGEVKGRIEEILRGILKIDTRCDVAVEQGLLGGFDVTLGDVRFDASVRGRLARMRERLLND